MLDLSEHDQTLLKNEGMSDTWDQWQQYPRYYRDEDMQQLAHWFIDGESGSLVGLPGIGRSTLFNIICHRPHALDLYVGTPLVLVPIDLNILPDDRLSTFYRVILRAFYQEKARLSPSFQHIVTHLYFANADRDDAFLSQSALLELLQLFHQHNIKVFWLLNHFAQFCDTVATTELIRTLRSLRDKFKETLFFLAGMTHEVAYFSKPDVVWPLYELLDGNAHWLKPLNAEDGKRVIAYRLRSADMEQTDDDIEQILHLTGGFPALIRAACHWRCQLEHQPDYPLWKTLLLQQPGIQHRLKKIWMALTQAEQFTLNEMLKTRSEGKELAAQHQKTAEQLTSKGVLNSAGVIFSPLFETFCSRLQGQGRGGIWLDQKTADLYQGNTRLDNLSPQEKSVLRFFVENPTTHHAHDDIIEAAWSDVENREGVTSQALYQQIRSIRKKIEPFPSNPVYVITQRGGYRFFPEGQPSSVERRG